MLLYKKKPVLLGAMVFVLLSFSLAVSVEASSIFWSYTYGGVPDETSGSSLVATSDGGYVIAGTIKLYDGTSRGVWLIKTDEFGFMEWNQTYESEQSYRASSLVATSDGGYAIAGTMRGDFWLIKTDSFGNMEWNQTYGGTHPDYAYSLVETSDEGYALAGSFTSEDVVQHDYWLVKTDAHGNMEWNKTYGKLGVLDIDIAYSLVETSDGGYALAGCTYTYGFVDENWGAVDKNFWLVKTDAFGNMMWNKTYGGTEHDIARSLVETSDGGLAIAGNTLSFGAGQYDFWLIKTDQYGNMEWNQTYGGPESEEVYSLIETSDGGYAIAGTQPYHPDPDAVYKYANFWLVKTDASGNMVWNETIGTSWDAEEAKSLVETIDGGYAIVGSTSHPKKGGSKLLLVKTDETGFLPEYHSLLLLSLLLIATLVSVINKKRLLQVHKNTKQ